MKPMTYLGPWNVDRSTYEIRREDEGDSQFPGKVQYRLLYCLGKRKTPEDVVYIPNTESESDQVAVDRLLGPGFPLRYLEGWGPDGVL